MNVLSRLTGVQNYRQEKLPFILVYGVIGIGVPVCVILNALILRAHGNLDLWFTVENAFELTYMLLLLAPPVGVLVGQAWWARKCARGEVKARLPSGDFEDAPSATQLLADRQLLSFQREVELVAVSSPEQLTRRIWMMTLVGYGYVVGIMTLLTFGTVALYMLDATVWFPARQIAVWVGIFVLFLLASLRVRSRLPEGQRITRSGSPAFFATLDDIQRKLDTPMPDVVLIDGSLNAAAAEIPRFGLLPVRTRYLIVGLPLLEALSTEECRVILAHELAHLSRRHSRRLLWVNRIAITWHTIAANLEVSRHWGRVLFLPFFRWYAPRFDILAQAVARRDEHESDALAAEYGGAETAARALVRLHVAQFFLADLQRPVYRQSAVNLEPPSGVFSGLGNQLRQGPNAGDADRWARRALASRTVRSDNHPSLADRLARLHPTAEAGVEASRVISSVLVPPADSGADSLLGRARVPRLRALLDSEWQKAVLPAWRLWHADALIWQDKDAANADELAVLRARMRWATSCEPPAVALPLAREMLHRVPGHQEASFSVAHVMIESDSEAEQREGLSILEDLLRRDSVLATFAGVALEAEYARLGWPDEVARVQSRQRALQRRLLAGARERSGLLQRDRVSAYPVPKPTLERIRKACRLERGLSEAFLVKKETRMLRDQPLVVLALIFGSSWRRPTLVGEAAQSAQAIIHRIVLPETADLLVAPVESWSAIARKLRAIPEALVYSAARDKTGI